MAAHESHHREQIALALKPQGMRLPEKEAIGDIGYTWYGDKKGGAVLVSETSEPLFRFPP